MTRPKASVVVAPVLATLLIGGVMAGCARDDDNEPTGDIAPKATAERELQTNTESTRKATATPTDESSDEPTEDPSSTSATGPTGKPSSKSPDGSGVGACYDGNCTVTITKSPTEIPLDPGLGLGIDSVAVHVSSGGVTIESEYLAVGGSEGTRGRINGLGYTIISVGDGTCVLQFSTGPS
ncbi:hypothetical protein [Actinopolymorpha alba]|uniref:hypothetical protein n=1 Tax=Actinopolymorpha alba TaxID=533267 RepID=UPI0003653058|nr:hypothetical protein [Actinopolymorpha alba]